MSFLRRLFGQPDVVKPSDQKAINDVAAILRNEFSSTEKLLESDGLTEVNEAVFNEHMDRINDGITKLKVLLDSLPDTFEYLRVKGGTMMYFEDRGKQLMKVIEKIEADAKRQ